MNARTVDLSAELLSGGLGKVAGKCLINGRLQANPEGVALVVQVVTSLFAPPPVSPHTLLTLWVLRNYQTLGPRGDPTIPWWPTRQTPAATRRGARRRRRSASESRRGRWAMGAQARARSQRDRR